MLLNFKISNLLICTVFISNLAKTFTKSYTVRLKAQGNVRIRISQFLTLTTAHKLKYRVITYNNEKPFLFDILLDITLSTSP